MVRLLVGGIVFALAACSPPVGGPSSTASSADTPAAGLRVHVDQLLGEHVFAIAKLSVAANAGRPDEFRSYAGMLAQNEADLTGLMRTALGETAGAEFGAAWTVQNDRLVDYIVATSTHNQAAADAATAALASTYVPQMASILNSNLGIRSDQASSLVSAHVAALKAVIDDAAAGAYPKLYSDIAAAHAEAGAFGDALSKQIVKQFPDRYPGDPGTAPVDNRVHLNAAVQRQAYLMTMASAAAVAGPSDEIAAASAALATNAAALPLSTALWTDAAALIIAYAKTGDPAVRQNVLSRAAAPPSLNAAFDALLKVVDDQRAKAYDPLATDDRVAATAFAVFADEASLGSNPSSPTSSA